MNYKTDFVIGYDLDEVEKPKKADLDRKLKSELKKFKDSATTADVR